MNFDAKNTQKRKDEHFRVSILFSIFFLSFFVLKYVQDLQTCFHSLKHDAKIYSILSPDINVQITDPVKEQFPPTWQRILSYNELRLDTFTASSSWDKDESI